MAKPQEQLLHREPLTLLITPKCGCKMIKAHEEAYIESKATGGVYCDMVCLCESEGIEYIPERRKALQDYYEVVSHG